MWLPLSDSTVARRIYARCASKTNMTDMPRHNDGIEDLPMERGDFPPSLQMRPIPRDEIGTVSKRVRKGGAISRISKRRSFADGWHGSYPRLRQFALLAVNSWLLRGTRLLCWSILGAHRHWSLSNPAALTLPAAAMGWSRTPIWESSVA